MRIAWASPSSRGVRLVAVVLAVVVVAIVAGIVLTPTVDEYLHTSRIYPGVQVAGMDLSGQTVDEATATIRTGLKQYSDTTLTIKAGDKVLTRTAAALGFAPRESDLALRAFDEGRDQGPMGFLTRSINGQVLGALSTDESWLVDSQAVDAAVAALAAEVQRAPIDAELTLRPQVNLKPSSVGQALDQAAARDIIWQQLVAMKGDEIDLPTTPVQPKVSTVVLQPVYDQATAVLGRGLALTSSGAVGSRTWQVSSAMLQDSLVLVPTPPSLDVKSDTFSTVVAQAAKDVFKSPTDATLTIKDESVRLTSDVVGWQVDQAATLTKLRESVLSGAGTSALVVNSISAKVTTADLRPTADDAQSIIAKGLKVTVGGKVGGDGNEAVNQTVAATPSEIGNMLVLKAGPDGKLAISLDANKVSLFVDRVNHDYQYPSLTARFVTWSGGKPQINVGVSIPAILIDKAQTVSAITTGWRNGTVTVGTVLGQMTVDQAFADRLRADLKGIMKERSISFAGSSPERAHNIGLALSRINGTVVAPGELYSFNISTGPTTIANGYTWGFAFTKDKTGQNVVVPSEAGGICQVATSVFQPIYLLGYTIEERNYHMFNLQSYAVNGYLGLDATVFPPYSDMKFRNDTGQYLLISSGTKGAATYVGIVGTKPNWTVSIGKEKISNVIPPPSGTITSYSDKFAKGRTITLEHPTNGFTSEVTRTVTYPDGTVRTLTFKSVYKPTQTQVLIGTGSSNPPS